MPVESAILHHQYVRAWWLEVSLDRWSQISTVLGATSMLIASWSSPTAGDITSILAGVTALVVAIGGAGRVYEKLMALRLRSKMWDYDHPTKRPAPPDSSEASGPVNLDPKLDRTRRRRESGNHGRSGSS